MIAASFIYTTSIRKLRRLRRRIKVIQGGTWAGKTYGIMAVIIDFLAKHEARKFTVVGETIPALKGGAIADFKTIMQLTNRWNENSYNATDRAYTFANGSVLEFKSFDTIGKAEAAGKRTDLFINECKYIPFEIADALMTRTSGNIWLDYNPTHEFWVHSEVLGDGTDTDVDFIVLKFTDNEACPDSIKKLLYQRLDKAKTSYFWNNWARVYIYGEIGVLQDAVLNHWRIIDFVPNEADLVGYGMDFGYTHDPTTLIGLHKWNAGFIWDELLYRNGMLNSDIAAFLKSENITRNHLIVADSSDPKSIDEINRYGFNIQGAQKGPDSVKFGLQLVKQTPLWVTARSVNTIRELRNYAYMKDKTGKRIEKPIDAFNHSIDAGRYIQTHNKKKRRNVLKAH